MKERYSQLNSILIERGYTVQEASLFISILIGLEDIFEWRKAGRWTDESRRKHGVMVRECFKRNRDAAEFLISSSGLPDKTVIGWDSLVELIGLKETTLRTMFSIAQEKNVIYRDINKHYTKIEYMGAKNAGY